MLDFYDQSTLRLDIRDMFFFGLVIDMHDLLPVLWEAVLPVKMPVSFRLQPGIATGSSFVRPMPRDIATAFRDHFKSTEIADSCELWLRLSAYTVDECESQ